MRVLLAALLGGTLAAAPASAFKSLEACDIVTFAAAGVESPVPIEDERWQNYRSRVEGILLRDVPEDGGQAALQEIAEDLVALQTELLAPVVPSDGYKDYLASDGCRLLRDLDASAVDGMLASLNASAPDEAIETARKLADGARAQVTTINRAGRFRSAQDRTLLFARYYCFAAGAIHALIPPEQQKDTGLATFGATMSCAAAGRQE